MPAGKQPAAPHNWTTVDRTPPVNAGHGPASVLPVGGTRSVVLNSPGPDADLDFQIATGDAVFSPAGFRMFLRSALADFDRVARATYATIQAERRRIHDAALTATATVRRRMARNVRATAASAYTLTERNAPHVLAAMMARAKHASDLNADTGLIPVVVS